MVSSNGGVVRSCKGMAQGVQRNFRTYYEDGGVMDLDSVPDEVFGNSSALSGVLIADV